MAEQRLCVSVTAEARYEAPHDEESWITIDPDQASAYGDVQRFIESFRAYLVHRGLSPITLQLETWPQVLEQYRRDGLVS